MIHSYPHNLVEIILEKWGTAQAGTVAGIASTDVKYGQLSDSSILETLISTCYQASIMLEEERPLRFRLMLRDPDKFTADDGPPNGLHRLIFSAARPFNEYELRKLAPAVDYYDSLIGVKVNDGGALQIWGLIHSGRRWIQVIRGGSLEYSPLPDSLVLYVIRPGQIMACKGSAMIAMLNSGKIFTPSKSVLNSRWLTEGRAETSMELWNLHEAARAQANVPWALLERNFPSMIAQQVTKRIISTVVNSHHGGTIISLSPERALEVYSQNKNLNIKYLFREEEPRNRFRRLLVKIMATLAESYGDRTQSSRTVGWNEYVASKNDILNQLDEAVFEYAHFVAGLTAIDGAVIMSQRQELIGFGAVILGPLDKVSVVARSLDSEGDHTVLEPVDVVGMRHRAVYQLCNELHDTMAMVISQDGHVDIVKWKNGIVTCWNVLPYPHFTENTVFSD
ncbi:MAG: putative sensor domain DACNV-containing protein [Dissulfurispiraceae bacterium]